MDRTILAAGAANTAAQLRVHLSQMTAASQLLERTAKTEKERAYLAVINQNICRMLRIIVRTELVHRLTDEDEIRLAPTLMDLGPWTQEFCAQAESLLATAGVALQWEAPESLLAFADGKLLQQMLLDLICNLVSQNSRLTLKLTTQGEKACFTLCNHGENPAPPSVAALFEADDSSLSGIAVARQIVALHGGTLMVDAGADRGRTVLVSLPLGLDRAPSGRLNAPGIPYPSGGFSPVLVGLSELLPSETFLPEHLD